MESVALMEDFSSPEVNYVSCTAVWGNSRTMKRITREVARKKGKSVRHRYEWSLIGIFCDSSIMYVCMYVRLYASKKSFEQKKEGLRISFESEHTHIKTIRNPSWCRFENRLFWQRESVISERNTGEAAVAGDAPLCTAARQLFTNTWYTALVGSCSCS